ncbi:MAG: tRNA (adenosine(37)-N6)-threonylcarbamoyltransferase complex dimerization subunit type 1 TsaB [Syntrophomonadaceae bacterium]|nr:tRNA (adenosine(37)-N6)-threonylcarbamoyltransferase complex dimerization subunit type 1 TsaB [Syntrophomonadaceae bacterium]MDH7497183.1 tRNA (adenosine(37)-N6)-threonylcarbamoyltransferase complex dimerization subunit type 1 TsaB [Syntrophomonadaceae bacterium]
MLVLAIESATPVAGVALVTESKLMAEHYVDYGKTHSQTLMVMVDQLLKGAGLQLGDLDALVVSAGPGSFTGLRIGMALGKGLALGAGLPLLGVSTLDGLALQAGPCDGPIWPMLDAGRGEVYTCGYRLEEGRPERVGEYRACRPERLVSEWAAEGESRVVVLGDGALRYRQLLEASPGLHLVWPPLPALLPRASSLGTLAVDRLRRGERGDAVSLVPVYARLSEAERRLQEEGR